MSDKSGSADDAAVLVSRKYLEELVRDAEAGRIFRACLNASAEIELDHLKKNPRSAEDVRRAALDSLAIIGLALNEAKARGLSKLDGDHLSWPLHALMAELGDVQRGRASPLLTPSPANKDRPRKDRPSGTWARNRLLAHMKAAACETLVRLTECEGWSANKAADTIAAIFEERGIKTNGQSAIRRNKDSATITGKTVKEWVRKGRKTDSQDTGLVLDEREDIENAASEFCRKRYFRKPGYGVLPIPDGVHGEVFLAHLRRYIAGTAYSD